MISDAHEIPTGQHLTTDICIIGAGAAGITLALELRSSGFSTVLLEGGGRKQSSHSDDLYRGHVAEGSSHEPLGENRRRVWGGSTTAWGGRCVRFDPIDFECRDYVPHSGWPFSIETLNRFYTRALEYGEAGPDEFDPRQIFPRQSQDLIEGFDGEDIVSTSIERWSPPTDFGRRYWRELQAAKFIQCFFHANCVGIRLNKGGALVERIDCASDSGRTFFVHPRFVVVASGGLETCRLLMASNDVISNGAGNQNDCLGRYYMAHLTGVLSWAEVNRKDRQFHYQFEKDRAGVYCRRRFQLTAKAQRKYGILNGIASFFRPDIGDPMHGSGPLSAAFMVKSMRFASRNWHRRDWRKLQGRHLANLAREFPALIPEVARQAFSRLLAERRIPTVLPPMSANRLYLQYQTEQAPNRDSRLRLHAERDRFGMPRLEVDIRFLDIDIRTVEKLHELLAAQFRKSGAGVVHYEQSRVREAIRAHLSRFSSISHHLGGARMAENPREGVVDADCRVHSVDNLFVASSAVFPTGSQANPTLTILALALRLAEHLRARVKRENCSNQTDALENYVFAKDWYESAELKKLPTLLRGVRTFADVGASVGPYTKCANEILQNGRIVAIEANRSTFERLSANCRRWEAESSNRIEVIHGAAADKRGTIDFFIPGRNELPLTSSLIENTDTSETWRKETVPCVMLDELFAEASPDLVKLDVEGAEYRVLKGANRLLQLGQCKFLIEIHPWGDPGLGKTPADIFKLLYGVGYDFRLVARHWYFYKAPKSLKMAFKHAAIMVVMRNSWLKDALKKLAVAAGRAAAIRPHAGGS